MLKCFLRSAWAVFSREVLPSIFFTILMTGLTIGIVWSGSAAWEYLRRILGQELLEYILGWMALICLLTALTIYSFVGLRRCAEIWRECRRKRGGLK